MNEEQNSIRLVDADSAHATFETPAGIVELGPPSLAGPMIVTSRTESVTESDLATMRNIAGTSCMLAAVEKNEEPALCAIRSAAFFDLATFRRETNHLVRNGVSWFRQALKDRGDFGKSVWQKYWQAIQDEERKEAIPM